MLRRLVILAAILAIAITGCSTTAARVKVKDEQIAVPAPIKGDIAVFGKIRLMEKVVVLLPAAEQDGSVYLRQEGTGKVFKIKCSKAGDFGVYLKAGRYRVAEVSINGYTFEPGDLRFELPDGIASAYSGTLVFDGTPTGVEPGTEAPVFIYTVKDEYKDFISSIKRAAPGSDIKVSKILMKASGATAAGCYPMKVFRAKDLERDLSARGKTVEEAVEGGIVLLTYVIDPVWLLTIH